MDDVLLSDGCLSGTVRADEGVERGPSDYAFAGLKDGANKFTIGAVEGACFREAKARVLSLST